MRWLAIFVVGIALGIGSLPILSCGETLNESHKVVAITVGQTGYPVGEEVFASFVRLPGERFSKFYENLNAQYYQLVSEADKNELSVFYADAIDVQRQIQAVQWLVEVEMAHGVSEQFNKQALEIIAVRLEGILINLKAKITVNTNNLYFFEQGGKAEVIKLINEYNECLTEVTGVLEAVKAQVVAAQNL